jgi:indolepyruvate ferredoxin oxidoreductase alpha subunit
MVIEEGQPVIEEMLRGSLNSSPRPILGKLDGYLPRTGELTPDSVKAAILQAAPNADTDSTASTKHPQLKDLVVGRPPALCQGCGHRDVYASLNAALESYEAPKVFGDIGCYTLGWLAPFNAIDTCLDMGASITMAKGAADAGQQPSVAIIGDSTFTHSGMTGLLDAINENTPMTVIISDNLTTGMTGGQDSQGTGKLEQICLGLGADPAHVNTIDSLPRTHEEMKALFRREFDYKGLSVIVARRECIQTARRHAKQK